LLGRKDAQAVEHVLVGPVAFKESGETSRQIGAVGQFGQKGRIKQSVEDVRPARDDGGQPGGRAHDRRKQLQQSRIGLEQREQLDAGGQTGEELVEAYQRLVRPARLAEGLQQCRRQFGQPLARLCRLGDAITAEMPAADDAADVARSLETEALQGLQRVGIINIAGKDQIADASRKLGRRFKQCRVVALDLMQRRTEGFGKGGRIGKTQHAGNAFEPLIVFRQNMRLLVGDHLDGMFDAAQEPVLPR
jgi:hypothetical protein